MYILEHIAWCLIIVIEVSRNISIPHFISKLLLHPLFRYPSLCTSNNITLVECELYSINVPYIEFWAFIVTLSFMKNWRQQSVRTWEGLFSRSPLLFWGQLVGIRKDRVMSNHSYSNAWGQGRDIKKKHRETFLKWKWNTIKMWRSWTKASTLLDCRNGLTS